MVDIEWRSNFRLLLKIPYSFTFNKIDYNGLTGNVSLTGLFLEKITPKLSPDSVKRSIEIQLELASKKLIFQARIVYVSDSEPPFIAGVGLEFLKDNDSSIKILKNYILKENLN